MPTLEMPSDIENKSDAFVKFESSKEHYKADACVVWCYDARFSELYDEFLAQKGFKKSKVDLVKGAGGAQVFALAEGPDKDVAESQLMKSITLHHTDRVVLMVHMDCGGYGGSKAFSNDHDAEWSHHVGELEKAAALVHAKFPEIKEIESYIADFDGLYRV